MEEISLQTIRMAQKTIGNIAINTPLIPSPFFSQLGGVEVLLKLETMQPIGAFKLRGAANAILNLPRDVTGVTCCSTGNHGRGVAFAARASGIKAVICMSKLVPQTKVDGIRALGAEVRIIGQNQDDAQDEVDRLVRDQGLHDLSPFDDPHVISGQGTIALELLKTRPDLETLLVPLSGGGLAGGIAVAAKSIKPSIRIIGITMDQGAAMHASIRAGHPASVTEVGSLADSLGGGIMDNNTYTLDLCTRLLDDTLLVSEEQIYHAMQTLFYEERLVAEGASCVGLAALQSGKIDHLRGPVAVIVTGRNVDTTMFANIINGQNLTLGDTHIAGRTYKRR
ncbi:MAG: hydroxyectoine utilization dehydratase EutB [Alphaproteobacteria bacterium]|nr:hydroxyectoine utilization dehydratase EutB [Alphaproteobacteria bacterium]